MRASPALLVAALLVAASCNSDGTGPTHGWLRVTTASSGFDIDPDGYALTVDGGAARAMGTDAAVVLGELPAGPHELRLEGLTPNCVPDGGTTHGVTVAAGDTALATFAVACAHRFGAVRVRAATTGQDLDPDGYLVRLDGGQPRRVGANDSLRFDGLLAGQHTVSVGGAATNCTIVSDTASHVAVVAGDTAHVVFTSTCVPRLGSLTVRTCTHGDDVDPDGYLLQVDGGATLAARDSDAVQFTGLAEGTHQVTLTGAAANCAVAGVGAHASAMVTFEQPGAVDFVIDCTPRTGMLVVSTRTSGADMDMDGFYVVVDSGTSEGVASNGVVVIPAIREGDHRVSLAGVSPNCHVVGDNAVAVHVTWLGTDSLAFEVSCTAFAVLHVSVSTSGVDLDATGYELRVRPSSAGLGEPAIRSVPVSTLGTATVDQLAAGGYTLQLAGVAPNCEVSPPHPRAVVAVSGQVVEAALDVVCATATPILYVSTDSGPARIFVVGSNGGAGRALTHGEAPVADPAWSPNGMRIAYANLGVGSAGIWVMNADGSNPVRLTSDTTVHDRAPTWSPDGSRLAFVRSHGGNADIAVMNADGSNPVYLTSAAAADRDPAWSPDGSRIAFASARDGDLEIYVMNADGSNAVQLTNNAVDDEQPDWSPDGTRIAFSRANCSSYCSYSPVVANADGSGARTLGMTSLLPVDPSWSPDGRHVALTTSYCDYYGYYCFPALATARVDGYDDVADLVGSDASQPAWRR